MVKCVPVVQKAISYQLAAITQHIPEKGAQMVRYYGWYSNKMRKGVTH